MSTFPSSESAASGDAPRVPPGQYLTDRFPVLHAGVVPDVDLATWDFTVGGLVAEERRWSWDEFRALPGEEIVTDIHCVTKWSKLDTSWEGVPVQRLWDQIEAAAGGDPRADPCVPRLHRQPPDRRPAAAAQPLGPHLRWRAARAGARLSASPRRSSPLLLENRWKWVRGLTLLAEDKPGFWERNGYHMLGDPWSEQRFWGQLSSPPRSAAPGPAVLVEWRKVRGSFPGGGGRRALGRLG